MPVAVPQSDDRSAPTHLPGAARFSSARLYDAHGVLSMIEIRHTRGVTFRSLTSQILRISKGDPFDAVDTTEETRDIGGTTQNNTGVQVSTRSGENMLGSTSTLKSVQPSNTMGLSSTQSNSGSSDVPPYHTPLPSLVSSQSSPFQRAHLRSSVIPVLVCSTVGAIALVLTVVLAICFCRRMRRTRASSRKSTRSSWWFTNEKEDVVVSIRVPPPAVPLKGILLPSHGPTSQSADGSHADRASLTSSQMSVIVNNLPKVHISDLEYGSLRVERKESPIRATRIGPSSSDFLAKLFGQSHSFPSNSSGCSQRHHTTSFPCNIGVPLTQRCGGFLGPFASHTPTLPQISAMSPRLGVSSGPRGHDFVFTGDQSSPHPSFAQWRYQRSLARDRA